MLFPTNISLLGKLDYSACGVPKGDTNAHKTPGRVARLLNNYPMSD